jgi:arginyl-tRNA synthetase
LQFPEDPLVEPPTISGYFMQFFFKAGPLVKTILPLIRQKGFEYGRNEIIGLRDPNDPSKGKKKIIVEFSSPNIAKPFHAGHLRSTIIGGFLSNLYEYVGWEVWRMNYLGDWGKQYGLLALAYERYGDEQALKEDPINHLYNIYVKINMDLGAEKDKIEALKKEGKEDEAKEAEMNSLDEKARQHFKKMTDQDPEVIKQWQHFRDLSIKKMRITYDRLNIRYDEYSGESQVPESEMNKKAETLAEKGLTEESDGASILDFSKHVAGKEGRRLEKPILRRKDGTALYLTRDISELLGRHEKYAFDQMIYVVASQQDLHLMQLFKIIELMGYPDIAKKCKHINFGMVHGMSTRKGTVKFLDDILKDVADKMHEVMRSNESKYAQVDDPVGTADILGISSVMVQDMSGKRSVASTPTRRPLLGRANGETGLTTTPLISTA